MADKDKDKKKVEVVKKTSEVKFNPITWRNVRAMKEASMEHMLPDEKLVEKEDEAKKKALESIKQKEPSVLQKLLSGAKERVSSLFSKEPEAVEEPRPKPFEEMTDEEKKKLLDEFLSVPKVPKGPGEL